MKRLATLISFTLGFAMLVIAFGIGWANWWELASHTLVMQTLMGALAAVVVLLLAMSILSKGKERRRATSGLLNRCFGVPELNSWDGMGCLGGSDQALQSDAMGISSVLRLKSDEGQLTTS